jgi:hypothetical protein
MPLPINLFVSGSRVVPTRRINGRGGRETEQRAEATLEFLQPASLRT